MHESEKQDNRKRLDRRRALLVWHELYRSWSWTGGHADREEDLLAVAMREAA